eukprot:6176583-Pleurochrysis_carterae.AAC.1
MSLSLCPTPVLESPAKPTHAMRISAPTNCAYGNVSAHQSEGGQRIGRERTRHNYGQAFDAKGGGRHAQRHEGGRASLQTGTLTQRQTGTLTVRYKKVHSHVSV